MMRYLHAIVILFVLAGASVGAAATATTEVSKIDAALEDRLERGGAVPTLILLAAQADTSPARLLPTKEAKGAAVVAVLRAQADRDQPAVLAALAARGIQARRFFSINALSAVLDLPAARMLAARPDVAALVDDSSQRRVEPDRQEPLRPQAPSGVEWNVTDVRAPEVWALGYRGQGIVVAGEDTGVYWQHDALKNQYRGWNGSSADHNYSWHDAIHSDIGAAGANPCGFNSAQPCDDYFHGSHTVGTIVGDDGGANQIGVAPGAKWIACRNMDNGDGQPSTYIECIDWMLAPYPVGGTPAQGDPAKAPDVVNNSWGCPESEGCVDTPADGIQQSIQSLSAAGIMFVSSAGNTGSGCGSIEAPPALYPETFVVGNYTASHQIAGSSSRGPVTYNGSSRVGPDLAAPGSNVRSVNIGGVSAYRSASGTSMAAPHVAGVIALLWSARPELRGQLDLTRRILQETANHTIVSSGSTCGGIVETTFPNNTWGHGRVDALAAIQTTLAGAITVNGSAATTATLTIASPAMQFAAVTGAYSTTLPSGTYTLTAQVAGFAPQSAVVTIASGSLTTQNFAFGAAANDIDIVDFGFSPKNLTVAVGTSVTWGNTGQANHTTTSDTALWDSGTLSPSQTFSRTFATAGVFPYHCTIHTGMIGTITVLESSKKVFMPLLRR
jgi:plastocyanin